MLASLILALALASDLRQSPPVEQAPMLFEQGVTFAEFLEGAKAERRRWTSVTDSAKAPAALVERLRRVGTGLRLLVVAEDWCIDSANTVPFLARLASAAGIDLRIVNRDVGRALLEAHRTPDGRVATPLVVLVRNARDVGAWVEHPAPLEAMFRTLATSPESARQFSDRQTWYDNDRGRTALSEFLALVERTHAGQ